MKKVTLIFVITLKLSLYLCARIECNWSQEYLCGDMCLELDKICFCGNNAASWANMTFTDSHDFICCHGNTSCFKNMVGQVHCPHGKKQDYSIPCGGDCKQTADYGLNTIQCKDESQCVKEVDACKGISLCNDFSDLSVCSESQLNCGENFNFENCRQLTYSLYSSSACKQKTSSTYNYFKCPNRLDKYESMFTTSPGVARTEKITGLNYNPLLRYNETGIICYGENGLVLPYEDLFKPGFVHLNNYCELLDGSEVSVQFLKSDLLNDFSFYASNIIDTFV